MSIQRRKTRYTPSWKDLHDRPTDTPFISKGYMTMKIPITLFTSNRQRLVDKLRAVSPNGLVLLQAAVLESCQHISSFVQDPFFFWAFGYQGPGVIGAINICTNEAYLIVQHSGKKSWGCKRNVMLTRSLFQNGLLLDGVWYWDEFEIFLDFMINNNTCKEVLILDEQKKELPEYIFRYCVDTMKLYPIISDLMVHKVEAEIKILRYCAKVLETSLVHIMKRLRPGISDHQMEEWYLFFMRFKSGFEQLSFRMCKGSDPVVCHRLRNNNSRVDRTLNEGEVCVIDVGAAYFGYHVKLGLVLPVNENFTNVQSVAYNLMLRMRLRVFLHIKAGTPFEHIQKTAERCLVQSMINLSLLSGTADGALESGVGKLLIPDQLVSSLDVGCENIPCLELGRVYLVQPGCHFNRRALEEAFSREPIKQYLRDELRDFNDIVVKVSDPVLITVNGFRLLSNISRSEGVMEGLRAKDGKRSPAVIQVEYNNLRVKPSLLHFR